MARNTKVKCLGHRDPKLWEEPSPQSPEVPGKSAHRTSAPTETPGAAPLPQVRPGVLTPSVCRLGPCGFQPSRCLLTAHLVEGAQRCSHPPHSPSGDNALLSSQLLDRCPVNLCGYVSTASPPPPMDPRPRNNSDKGYTGSSGNTFVPKQQSGSSEPQATFAHILASLVMQGYFLRSPVCLGTPLPSSISILISLQGSWQSSLFQTGPTSTCTRTTTG